MECHPLKTKLCGYQITDCCKFYPGPRSRRFSASHPREAPSAKWQIARVRVRQSRRDPLEASIWDSWQDQEEDWGTEKFTEDELIDILFEVGNHVCPWPELSLLACVPSVVPPDPCRLPSFIPGLLPEACLVAAAKDGHAEDGPEAGYGLQILCMPYFVNCPPVIFQSTSSCEGGEGVKILSSLNNVLM